MRTMFPQIVVCVLFFVSTGLHVLANESIVMRTVLIEDTAEKPFDTGVEAAKQLLHKMDGEPIKAVIITECFEDRPAKELFLQGICSVLPKAKVFGLATHGSMTEAGCRDSESASLFGIGGTGIAISTALVTDLKTKKLTVDQHAAEIHEKLVPAGEMLAKKINRKDDDKIFLIFADAHTPKIKSMVEGTQNVLGKDFTISGGCANKNEGQTFIYYQGDLYEDAALAIMLSGEFTVSQVGRMANTNDTVIQTGKEAAAAALEKLDGKPLFAFVIDCGGRRNKLERIQDELDAMQDSIGKNVPLFGGYCSGEIGPIDVAAEKTDAKCGGTGWHLMFNLFGTKSIASQEQLLGTLPLEGPDDVASRMITGIDTFLLRETEKSVGERESFWKRDFSTPESYQKSIQKNQEYLAQILGVRDSRKPFASPELIETLAQSPVITETETYRILAIRWPVFENFSAEGLLIEPKTEKRNGTLIFVPHAGTIPEHYVPSLLQNTLAGTRIIIPAVVSRKLTEYKTGTLSNREFIYRSAFELGRHIIGYEVQEVLALMDWLKNDPTSKSQPITVAGYGDGGMISLFAGALDSRITAVTTIGYLGDGDNLWQQMIDRNVFGLLERFGDAQLAMMIYPRSLKIIDSAGPSEIFTPKKRTATQPENEREIGGPGRLVPPVASEVVKQMELLGKGNVSDDWFSYDTSQKMVYKFPELDAEVLKKAELREKRIVDGMDRHSQQILAESPEVRRKFMAKLDTKSLSTYEKSLEWYRNYFAEEVIGRFTNNRLPFNPRSRLFLDTPELLGYEVVLDVFEDVIATGLLLIPKGIPDGEKRPVVVCQHGLGSMAKQTLMGGKESYHGFSEVLAKKGYIVFAPQNIYIFSDRFRTLQRKANPLKKTLFSIMVPQHQQIVDWLGTLPFVDANRIGFYGLSYGGKSAMRIPPLVPNYTLSICSADFNEWVVKNASTLHDFSYVWKGEYEIFEFDLGSTFNYAEMAALVAPRPFMVERGHTDGVGKDEFVAFEYAKVRFLYQSRLKIGDRTTIEWFDGGHKINGMGTFNFLDKHLNYTPTRQ